MDESTLHNLERLNSLQQVKHIKPANARASDCDRKVASSSPCREHFLLQSFFHTTLTVCAESYSASVLPVLPQWHVKDPGHSAKTRGGRLHLNTHTPVTQANLSRLTMLFRHSVGT